MSEVLDFNRRVIDEFRANGGRVGGFFEGAPLLILKTVGAKSGIERVSPVMYRAIGDTFVVFGTYAGAPVNPAWYHNLIAHPEASIEVGSETIAVMARIAEGTERDEIWEAQKNAVPGFADYEAKTDRVMPVVILGRLGATS